jgi:hypothetical protein
MSQPYVYTLTHKVTGEFYIGYRCANKVPALEDLGIKYFSSSESVKLLGFENFNCTIIAELESKNDAIDLESKLISESWGNPLLLNKHNKGSKFRTIGPRSASLKQKLSNLHKGVLRGPMTLEHRKKIGAANLGMTLERGRKPLSNATKSKMSETHRTVKSNLRLLELRECPHCNIVVTAGNFARWHGEKCKYQSSVQ